MSKLTAKARNALPSSAFGDPVHRKYPEEDRGHAIAAKSRASHAEKVGRISPAMEARIDRKADKMLHKGKDGYSSKEKSEHSKGMEHYSKGGYGPKGHSGGKAVHESHEGSGSGTFERTKMERKSHGEHDFHRGGHMGHDGLHDHRMQEHHRFVDGKAASHIGERDGSLRKPLKIHGKGNA